MGKSRNIITSIMAITKTDLNDLVVADQGKIMIRGFGVEIDNIIHENNISLGKFIAKYLPRLGEAHAEVNKHYEVNFDEFCEMIKSVLEKQYKKDLRITKKKSFKLNSVFDGPTYRSDD